MISNLSHITLILITLWIGAKGFTVYYKREMQRNVVYKMNSEL